MKILYIHHCGPFGGSSRSLYEALKSLPRNDIEFLFICPSGDSVEKFRELGEVFEARGITKLDNTFYSHYRGIRWFVLMRELYFLPYSIISLAKLKMKHKNIDIVHFNESCLSIFAIFVRMFFKAHFFVHCRTLMIGKKALSGRLSDYLWGYFKSKFIAIDKNVAMTLPQELLTEESRVRIIHNGFRLGLKPDLKIGKKDISKPFRVGFVGGLHKAKGCFELTKAIINLTENGRNVNLTIVGDDKEKNNSDGIRIRVLKYFGLYQNISKEIFQLISLNKDKTDIKFTGFQMNIAKYYNEFDVIVFPSYYDAPGRPIFEGALFGVPSIAAINNPQEDTFRPYETGIQIKPKSTKDIELAIEYMIDNPESYKIMCSNSFELAWNNFNIDENSKKLFDFYNSVNK